jgi:hypothetical protein
VCRDLHDDSVSWQRAWHDSRRAPGRTLTDGPPAEKEGVLVDSLAYASAPVTVRRDLVDAQIRAWRGLGRPGTWWTGAERVAIAAEVRAAARCALCLARKAALSPYTVAGIHDGPAELPPVVIEAVHRIATDPGRLTRQWFVRLLDGGLGDAAYVELLGVLVTVLGIDAFCRAIGVPPHPLPHAESGTPARTRPAAARDEGAWVPTIPGNAAGGEFADLYADIPGLVPNVIRALSLVPDALRTMKDLGAAHYMTTAEMTDLTHGRSLSRAQMELIAGRMSALRECFY